jgi:hypothetical protein
MKPTTSLALATALGASLFAGAAHAQDMGRDFDTLTNSRAEEGEAVRMRLTIPFGQAAADPQDTRLSFALQQSDGYGTRNLDVVSLSLSGAPRLESPVMGVNGEGGFFSKPINWLWIGLGVGAAYWIYEETQDDDDPQQQLLF